MSLFFRCWGSFQWESDGEIIYGTIMKRTKNKYKVLSTDDDEYYKDKKDLTKL